MSEQPTSTARPPGRVTFKEPPSPDFPIEIRDDRGEVLVLVTPFEGRDVPAVARRIAAGLNCLPALLTACHEFLVVVGEPYPDTPAECKAWRIAQGAARTALCDAIRIAESELGSRLDDPQPTSCVECRAVEMAYTPGAPDHALLLSLMVDGRARWRPSSSHPGKGELCVGGLCHATELDDFGCPKLTHGILKAIREGAQS